MTDFAQQPGESPAAWLERLRRTRIESDLTNERRIDLGRHIQDAQRAAGGMPQTPSTRPPEALANSLIDVGPTTPGGPYFIRLKGTKTVHVGPYENPDLAFRDAVKVRAFLAEVIAQARQDGAAGA